MKTLAVLSTGSNLGDRAANIEAARRLIAERIGEIEACSAVRESAPWGDVAPEGDESAAGMPGAAPPVDFLNQVLAVRTALSPEELLAATQQIERELGRENKKYFCNAVRRRYRSRTMDVDILYYGRQVIDTPSLSVPHPLIAEREFVLVPLAEALPGLRHPVDGKTAGEMLAELKSKQNR